MPSWTVIFLIAAILAFVFEAWKSKSLVAAGLALFAASFLPIGG